MLHLPLALVAQWIERRPPEPGAQVRVLPGARGGVGPNLRNFPAALWRFVHEKRQIDISHPRFAS